MLYKSSTQNVYNFDSPIFTVNKAMLKKENKPFLLKLSLLWMVINIYSTSLELVYIFCEFLAEFSQVNNESLQKTCIKPYLFTCLHFNVWKSHRKSWKIAIFPSMFCKLLPTQTENGPRKYAVKCRAAGYYNGTHTSGVLVNLRAVFSVILHVIHLCVFFAKTWLPRLQFLRVCSLFLSNLCLLYAKILEIYSNRLYTS